MLIAAKKHGQAGFSLIELMIAMAIFGMLAAAAFPSFEATLKNARVRNGAEAISNGLQRARAEAVAQNTQVAFVKLGDGSSWQVSVVGAGDPIDKRSESEGSKDVKVEATPPLSYMVTFNNVGRVVPNNDGSDTVLQFDITAADASSKLRITIGGGGNIRMCDLTLAAGSNPRAC